MNWINQKNYVIYFGDENDNLRDQADYHAGHFLKLYQKINAQEPNSIDCLFFLKQNHGNTIFVLDDKNKINTPVGFFQRSGDAIITAEKKCAIGVVTADCLPVVLYDQKNNVVGIVHAGWRGLASKIMTATINKMREYYGTHSSDLIIHLGPSAGVCCYEVQSDLLTHFAESIFEKKIAEKRNGKIYFNPMRAAHIEALADHVASNNIHSNNNHCTICTPGYCSARKHKENAGRQPSVVILR
ncbi:MAG: hypothetical protein A3C44_04445 [Gammaproteobacteria bacterium RIFCSPHIGHO2_02_FULL_39_13]|nr:MAG: hypothetical protein A3C44_04445 [Gammaproteobacteria bacterium RIFCSPHIGHO2_02_FULL_39_13]